jgi:CheY-like chemotaxis protein
MSFLGTSEHRRAGAHRPHLRMLRGDSRPDRETLPRTDESSRELPPVRPATSPERSQILVAGADPERRAAVLADLVEALPADTQFGEAQAAWEVLEQAPASDVVMLAGDLDEVTAESLMNVLGHRHPSLPVVALGLFAASAPARSGRLERAAAAVG